MRSGAASGGWGGRVDWSGSKGMKYQTERRRKKKGLIRGDNVARMTPLPCGPQSP